MDEKVNWLFDVDGTLTASRLKIDSQFQKFFLEWCKAKKVFFVTGSNYEKTLEQVGPEILTSVTRVYASMGNSVWEKGIKIKDQTWTPPQSLYDRLQAFVDTSIYPLKTSNHIEDRPGMVNFSVIGRDCTQEERLAYYEWDKIHGERLAIQSALMQEFPDLSIQIGGQISMDIIPVGKDKAQVYADLEGQCVFFGDHIHPGGNDMALATALLEAHAGHTIVHVTSWEDTQNKLTNLFR